ncbi:unnamed protein product [Leptidea sinapis]|uniref:C2H2-type domain-containing protein n=1 Tax=Leptidea sinapis TaxID=189913 RepID=A0A5E4QU23_9NEOP|nr:unnamed protein product [Leptidea sinapis]
MPPLICEDCADKVCEFYEFREMCQQRNKRTRLKLGLPYNKLTKNMSTMTHFKMDMSKENEPESNCKTHKMKLKKESKNLKIKHGKILKIKKQNRELRRLRGSFLPEKRIPDEDLEFTKSLRSRREPTPPSPPPPPPPTRSALKRTSSMKEEETRRSDAPPKKVRIVDNRPIDQPRGEKKKVESAKVGGPKQNGHWCKLCKTQFISAAALYSHNRWKHIPDEQLIEDNKAIDPSKEKKKRVDKAEVGKLKTNGRLCKICKIQFQTLTAYASHFRWKHSAGDSMQNKKSYQSEIEKSNPKMEKSKQERQKAEIEVKCEKCSRIFSNKSLLKEHTCSRKKVVGPKSKSLTSPDVGKDKRVTGPAIESLLLPRVLRFTKLSVKGSMPYGLDKRSKYPYGGRKNKNILTSNRMVDINAEIDSDFENNMNWDLDESDSVESLKKLSLNVIISKKFLGEAETSSRLGSDRSSSSSPDIFAGFKSHEVDRSFEGLSECFKTRFDSNDDTSETNSDVSALKTNDDTRLNVSVSKSNELKKPVVNLNDCNEKEKVNTDSGEVSFDSDTSGKLQESCIDSYIDKEYSNSGTEALVGSVLSDIEDGLSEKIGGVDKMAAEFKKDVATKSLELKRLNEDADRILDNNDNLEENEFSENNSTEDVLFKSKESIENGASEVKGMKKDSSKIPNENVDGVLINDVQQVEATDSNSSDVSSKSEENKSHIINTVNPTIISPHDDNLMDAMNAQIGESKEMSNVILGSHKSILNDNGEPNTNSTDNSQNASELKENTYNINEVDDKTNSRNDFETEVCPGNSNNKTGESERVVDDLSDDKSKIDVSLGVIDGLCDNKDKVDENKSEVEDSSDDRGIIDKIKVETDDFNDN